MSAWLSRVIRTACWRWRNYEAEETRADENPPVGLILCTDKNDAVVRYMLSQSARSIFASRYQLHLPTEDELLRKLQQERALIEREHLPDSP